MVVDRAQIDIKPGEEDAFVASVRWAAADVLPQAQGYRSVRLYRGIESPSRFLMLVEWDSLEDHERFRDTSELVGSWLERLRGYVAGPPEVGHFELLES